MLNVYADTVIIIRGMLSLGDKIRNDIVLQNSQLPAFFFDQLRLKSGYKKL